MRNIDEEKPLISNRDKKTAPRLTKKSWCMFCDANLVHPDEKCSRCGKKEETKRFKK